MKMFNKSYKSHVSSGRRDIKKLLMYRSWSKELLNKIEALANKHYPDVTYWVDTGSQVDVAFAILDQIDKDLTEAKKSWWEKLFC